MINLVPLFGPRSATGQTTAFRLFPRRGAERWMLETRFRRPWHLETWPQANRRAKVIYRAARLLGDLGLNLPSRRITLSIGNDSLYAQLRGRFDALGIFLGTPGPNRKVVVFARGREGAWFIKVPIGETSAALAQTEASVLDTLAGDPNLSPLVPRCLWIDEALAIEDVRAAGAIFAPLDPGEVLRVHALLFARSRSDIPLADLVRRWTASEAEATPHGHPGTARAIAAARAAARSFLGSLAPDTAVECYEAHGDFTRWNVLRAADGSARIIDWELFGVRPKFFDPFHYLVSQAILVDRLPAPAILERAERLAEGADSLDIYSRWLYFGLYVAGQVCYYSGIYERQTEFYAQAFWQLETWTELLEMLCARPPGDANRLGPGAPKNFGNAQ